jgi:hypothetical protein
VISNELELPENVEVFIDWPGATIYLRVVEGGETKRETTAGKWTQQKGWVWNSSGLTSIVAGVDCHALDVAYQMS